MTAHSPPGPTRPEGYHSITPFIVCDPAADAIEFYRQVFDAEVLGRNDGPNGTVMHAEIRIGDSIMQLSDPMPTAGLVAPDPNAASASLALYVPDVEETFARAVRAGATVREEVSTFVTGDRFGSVVDPFGRRWAIMTRVEEVSREEAERRINDWIASLSSTS